MQCVKRINFRVSLGLKYQTLGNLSRYYSNIVVPDVSKTHRFWERITVESDTSCNQVCINGSPLRTPEGKPLNLPLSKPTVIAHLIAQEWRALSSLKLKSHMVPLTSLAGRSLDMTSEERNTVTDKLLPYLDTDTLVVLSPRKDCNGELRKAQDALFPPIVEDAKEVWGLSSDGIIFLDTEVQLFGHYQPAETKVKVRDWINSLDDWQFASLERATTAAKSLILGMNIVLNRRSVAELAALSSLDVTHQTALWGEVEDTHDVDAEDLPRLLGAAYINALSKTK